MKWAVDFLPEAADDLTRLDGSQRQIAVKAIESHSGRSPAPCLRDYLKSSSEGKVFALFIACCARRSGW